MVNKLVGSQGLVVDLLSETKNGLVLCLSDIDDSNFIVDSLGNLWSIDFGGTGYMPPSFVYYSLRTSPKAFTQLVASLVKYPPSPNLKAMRVAAGQLVVSGNNSLGE